jgi:catechol 2,3-dioxygenase-like lactoylglutathione lyase family enzyme
MSSPIRFGHVNIAAHDWRRLSRFYCDVFGCTPVPPERNLSGDWLARGAGVAGIRLQGQHLRLPGYGPGGPTLEIYSYQPPLPAEPGLPNRRGFGHIAFAVPDVEAACKQVVQSGGYWLGRPVRHEVPGVGRLHFAYMRDPEDNVIELQHWENA